MPTYPSSPDSNSLFSEIEGSAGSGESSTSLSKTQTRYLTPGVEPLDSDQKRFHFQTSPTAETDSDGGILPGSQDIDPLRDTWRKLVGKKDEVLKTRDEIRRTRGRMRLARGEKDDADNAFMALLRPLLVIPATHPSAMLGNHYMHFRRMQQTRDKYQTFETRLESLEDKLDQIEHQLDTLERQLINELRADPPNPLDPINGGEPPPLPDPGGTVGNDILPLHKPLEAVDSYDVTALPELLLGIAPERAEDHHPLYNKFMSAIGYLQLAQEHHNDLLMRKNLIEEEQERLILAEDQERKQWRLVEELKLAKEHEQAWISLDEEHQRQRLRLEEEQKLERSRLAEEDIQSNSTLYARKLRDEDLEFLREFEVDEQIASQEVRRLREEVKEFQQVCQEKGVLPRYAPLHEVYSYERDYEDDISIDFDPPTDTDTAEHLASSRFPVLLSNPSHLMRPLPVTAKAALKQATRIPESDPRRARVFGAAAKEFFIENLIHDARENDKSDFINRWLLHKLRISPLEAELLYSCFFMESHLKILNLKRWQQDVLYYWPRDDAARLRPEDFLGTVTPEDTQLQVGGSEIPPDTLSSQRVDHFNEHISV